ncbi:MAG: hypothetical protein PF637_09270 [Spirochaetes bacterium]|nr:hypothetical protein [Spirochaetota bacterium]
MQHNEGAQDSSSIVFGLSAHPLYSSLHEIHSGLVYSHSKLIWFLKDHYS